MGEAIFACFDLEQTIRHIAADVGVEPARVRGAIELLDAGNTIPFIARYRKEATRGLDETALRRVEDALSHARELAERKATILKTIDGQGQLTGQLRTQIEACMDRTQLEDLYLPFKPKRRTRATAAREKGLEPLAVILLRQQPLGRPRSEILQAYVSVDKGVPDEAAALAGACDIVAEQWSEDADTRGWLLAHARRGDIVSQVRRGKRDEASKFDMYFDHREPIAHLPSHRLLAMRRGQSEDVLRVGIAIDDDQVLAVLKSKLVGDPDFEFHQDLLLTAEDCYRRLLFPAVESAVLQELKERADEQAIGVFAKNLRQLLLAHRPGPRSRWGWIRAFAPAAKWPWWMKPAGFSPAQRSIPRPLATIPRAPLRHSAS